MIRHGLAQHRCGFRLEGLVEDEGARKAWADPPGVARKNRPAKHRVSTQLSTQLSVPHVERKDRAVEQSQRDPVVRLEALQLVVQRIKRQMEEARPPMPKVCKLQLAELAKVEELISFSLQAHSQVSCSSYIENPFDRHREERADCRQPC